MPDPSHLSVPLLDLKAQYAPLKAQMMAAVERVLDSQNMILGDEVVAMESELARYLEVGHAIGVSSGSDALVLALRALGVGPGDAVLCPTYTFFATAGGASRLGATPVFLDSEPDTLNLSLGHLARYLSEEVEQRTVGGKAQLFDRARNLRVAAVVPVHLFGQSVPMDRLMALCAPRGIPVVEDAAQALGARFQGKPVGTFGAAGCFSFYPSKNLGACGDAGLVITNDAALNKRIRRLRVHGSEPKYLHHEVGYNFRIDALQAAMLRVKLAHLPAWTLARQRVAERYGQLFVEQGLATAKGGPVRLPVEAPGCPGVYHQYVIRVSASERDGLIDHLQKRRIGSAVYYPIPLHLQPCYAELGYRKGQLPVAEQAAADSVALPIYPELTEAQLGAVVAGVAAFYASGARR